ncbi:hypothetical protein ABIE65_003880 [Constrictibacter sp. MBR-5]|jgi:hypothetical protein|uniref:DUF938 domain-containing protein n=1 Tax=Constrictibacter sp. MBR-5 TaxID=3156467 RepID=UPI003391DCD9
MDDSGDRRRYAPAAQLNRAPILGVLDEILPRRGTVLEVGSGSGEHAVYMASKLPGIVWQPSERDDASLASIEAWRMRSGLAGPLPNLLPPVRIDLAKEDWPADVPAEAAYPVAVVAINVLQASAWAAAVHLFAGAASLLMPDRLLYLYGPFRRGGQHTSMGNAQLDRDLRSQNEDWGVRDFEDVADLGAAHRLVLEEVVRMPNNNLSLIFARHR